MATSKHDRPKTEKPTAVKKAEQPSLRPHRKVFDKSKAIVGSGGSQFKGFIDFIRTQGVIGLAVGLAIGSAAGDTVKKLVEGFITPVVQFIVGTKNGLEMATWHLELFGRSADFKWGAFVSSLITLLATAVVIYAVIHLAKLDRLDKKKG